MNKLVIGAFFVAALGGAIIYLNPSSKTPQSAPEDTASQESETLVVASKNEFSGTLSELIKQSSSLQCTFSQADAGNTVSGTTYISNGRFRTDYSATIAAVNQVITGHMIYDGTNAYTWMSLLNQGFKIKAPSVEDLSKTQSSSQSFDLSKTNLYSCSPWSVDLSLFVPPQTITFSEFALPIGNK